MKMQKRDLQSQVITFEVCFPDSRVQEMLKVAAEEPVYHVIRLRILDGQPYILEHSFMPVDLVTGLTKEILHRSVYDYLLEELNYKFAGAYRTFQAAKSDEYDRQYLKCQSDDPVLELEQIIYLESGRPIDYSRSRNRYDVRGYSMLRHETRSFKSSKTITTKVLAALVFVFDGRMVCFRIDSENQVY